MYYEAARGRLASSPAQCERQMQHGRIPIVVLAGSDPAPARLPEQGRDKHPLAGYKSVRVKVGGRPLITHVVEQLAATGRFAEVLIAGPHRVYAEHAGPAGIIDTDATLGLNVRASVEHIRSTAPATSIAFTVCDILPDARTLDRLMQHYEEHVPCDLWAPLVRAPQRPDELGASAWKPSYGIVPEGEKLAVRVLPGHLVIGDPRAMRLNFVYRLLDVGYQTRNRSIDRRRGQMIRGALADMLLHDLRQLARLRPPTLTWSVLRTAIPATRLLREGVISQRRLEATVRKVFVRSRHRRMFPERRVVLPIVEALSMARDIDTEEEASELGGRVAR